MSRSRLAAVLRSLVAQGGAGLASRAQSPVGHAATTLRPVMLGLIHSLEAEALRHRNWSPGTQQRGFSSDDMQTDIPDMSEARYHQLADQTLDDLHERLEIFMEKIDLDDGDIEYSQGVLTLKLGDLGTYVVNKQAPNRQIWMSSPVSGPVRYDFVDGKWEYHRDGHHMLERLQKELVLLTGADPDLSPCYGCGKMNTCQGEQCRSD